MNKRVFILVAVFFLLFPFNLFTSVEKFPGKRVQFTGSIFNQTIPVNFLDNLESGDLISYMLRDTMFASADFFDRNYILAYYGHPNSRLMGIVGRHPKPELAALLKITAEKYDNINQEKGVVPAIYLIYGTCQPGGRINRMSRGLVESYIKFAHRNGILIYLDHQIGRYSPEEAMKELLPFLKYPNVHLAIDPEWRTAEPMRKIGSITADELNNLQRMMRDYILENNIPGKRQLVFHQFDRRMIRNIGNVRSDYDPVILVHATSGWGCPGSKISTHVRNSRVVNIPYKGFKLWYYYSDRPGIHYDYPLMTPEQVLGLNPEPKLIIYQ